MFAGAHVDLTVPAAARHGSLPDRNPGMPFLHDDAAPGLVIIRRLPQLYRRQASIHAAGGSTG